PTLWAELRWAARAEQVVHLEDLLLRRTRLGLLLPAGGLAEFERIREVCQPELGWSDQRWQMEVSNYLSLWQRSYSPPGAENSPLSAGIPMACPTLAAR
ncbi:MAG: glycerol-3-phosphate dehydrogenase C-terminal domain-containing protein, partial [Bellilinea sp.]